MAKAKEHPGLIDAEAVKALVAAKQSLGSYQRKFSKGVDALSNLIDLGDVMAQAALSIRDELQSLVQLTTERYRECNRHLAKIGDGLNDSSPSLPTGGTNNRKETSNAAIQG